MSQVGKTVETKPSCQLEQVEWFIFSDFFLEFFFDEKNWSMLKANERELTTNLEIFMIAIFEDVFQRL